MSILKFLETTPTIQEVEKKIESLRGDIRMLEQYRNARLLIVSRLPPEVLSLIFEHLALARQEWDSIRHYSYPYRQLLSVSQVCRLWRTIALDSPRIWGCIYDNTPRQIAALFLERARSAPLYLRQGGYVQKETVELLLEHLDQLWEIELPRCRIEWLEQLVRSQVPMLEALVIKLGNHEGFQARFAPDVAPGRIPPLRHLELEDCIFELDAPFFSHLRTLKLSFFRPNIADAYRPSMDVVLLAVQAMPRLETLQLFNVLAHSDEGSTGSIVSLPRLTHFRVSAQDIRCLSILTRVACPSIQSVTAGCRGKATPETLAPIAAAFYALIPAPPSTRWHTTVKLEPSPSSCYAAVAIWLEDEPIQSSNPDNAPFQLSVAGDTDFQTDLTLCALLPSAEPMVLIFNRARTYYTRQDEDLNRDALQTLLQSLKNVDSLRVSRLSDLLLVLSDTPEKGRKTKPGTPFSLPSLRYINWRQKDSPKYKKRMLSQLKKILTARKALEVGIETLTAEAFYHGYFQADELEFIRDLVTTFETTLTE